MVGVVDGGFCGCLVAWV